MRYDLTNEGDELKFVFLITKKKKKDRTHREVKVSMPVSRFLFLLDQNFSLAKLGDSEIPPLVARGQILPWLLSVGVGGF